MNKEIAEGKFDQASGAVKQKVGETFGNQKLANAGAAEQIKGAAKETWGKAKDVAADQRDDAAVRVGTQKETLAQRTEDAAHNLREDLVEGAKNTKNRISEKLEEFREKHDRA